MKQTIMFISIMLVVNLLAIFLFACNETSPKDVPRPNPAIDPLDPNDPSVTFTSVSKYIFQKQCMTCHNERLREGDLSLASYASLSGNANFSVLIKPGDPENSKMYQLIETQQMPPKGQPVNADRQKELYWWIKYGAKNN